MANVVMPQMGESIAEGTIVRWIKKVGDSVDRDEPLFEISTDKVDAEIPSPSAGVLTEIKVKEGETVPVNSVVAIIGSSAGSGQAPSTGSGQAPGDTAASAGNGQGASSVPAAAVGQPEPSAPSTGTAVDDRTTVSEARPSAGAAPSGSVSGGALSKEDLRRQKSSPLVRRIAKEHNVDIQQIQGTGISGRVTKTDILGYIDSGAAKQAPAPARTQPTPGPVFRPGENVQVVPMSVMRRKIAEHMVLSAHTSPHVYSVYEVNFGRVASLRDQKKAQYEAAGDRKSTRLNSSHLVISYAVFCLKKKKIL